MRIIRVDRWWDVWRPRHVTHVGTPGRPLCGTYRARIIVPMSIGEPPTLPRGCYRCYLTWRRITRPARRRQENPT